MDLDTILEKKYRDRLASQLLEKFNPNDIKRIN